MSAFDNTAGESIHRLVIAAHIAGLTASMDAQLASFLKRAAAIGQGVALGPTTCADDGQGDSAPFLVRFNRTVAMLPDGQQPPAGWEMISATALAKAIEASPELFENS